MLTAAGHALRLAGRRGRLAGHHRRAGRRSRHWAAPSRPACRCHSRPSCRRRRRLLDVAPARGRRHRGRPPAGPGAPRLPPLPARPRRVQGRPRRRGRHSVDATRTAGRAGTVHLGGTLEEIAAAEGELAAGGCRSGRSSWLDSSTSPTPPARPATYTGLGVCARAGRLHRRRHRGDPGQIERFAPGVRDRIRATAARGPRSSPRTTRTMSAATSPPAPTTCASCCCGPGSRPTRTGPACRASTCARRPPRRAPGARHVRPQRGPGRPGRPPVAQVSSARGRPACGADRPGDRRSPWRRR